MALEAEADGIPSQIPATSPQETELRPLNLWALLVWLVLVPVLPVLVLVLPVLVVPLVLAVSVDGFGSAQSSGRA